MSTALPQSADVIVVGGGNAAFCAALAAQEQGVSVLVLERAPEDEAGGNSRFTAGAFRCVYDGVEDLRNSEIALPSGRKARLFELGQVIDGPSEQRQAAPVGLRQR